MNRIFEKNIFLFDLDGTLINSMENFSKAVLSVLEENNISYPDGIVPKLAALGYQKIAEYYHENYGLKNIEKMRDTMSERAYAEYRDNIELKSGVFDFLNMCKNLNISLNVLTASPYRMIEANFKRNKILGLFDHLLSSEEFGLSKSDPNIYPLVAKKLNTDIENIVFFDDNVGNIGAAKKSKVLTVGVYDISGDIFTEDMKNTADIYINSFTDFKNAFIKE